MALTTRQGKGSKLTANEMDGNLTYLEELTKKPYKIYSALLTQTGTGAPVATVLENTLGNIVWTRDSRTAGFYKGTLAGAFTRYKTAIILGNKSYSISDGTVPSVDVQAFAYNDSDITINTLSNSGLQDDVLLETFIEVRVYN